MKAITIAKMISLHDPTPVMLPSEFVDETVAEASSAILILAPSKQILRLIPTKNPTGLKIVIDIEKFSPGFLLELELVLSRYQLKTFYNTGLCFTHDSCIYEGYFDLSELSVAENQLKEELSEIKCVSDVKITKITT